MLLSADTKCLEVGISAGSHGWLRIRAELTDTGMVAAQVTTANPHAAQHFEQESSAISAFLTAGHVGLSDLFVQCAGAQAGTQQAMQGSSSSAQHGQRQRQQADEPPPPGPLALDWPGVPAWVNTISSPIFNVHSAALGGWLSVRV